MHPKSSMALLVAPGETVVPDRHEQGDDEGEAGGDDRQSRPQQPVGNPAPDQREEPPVGQNSHIPRSAAIDASVTSARSVSQPDVGTAELRTCGAMNRQLSSRA